MSTNEPMTQEQLDTIRARVDRATEGPWSQWSGWDQWDHSIMGHGPDDVPEVASVIPELDDSIFIAHARQDVPALLAEVERLRAALDQKENQS